MLETHAPIAENWAMGYGVLLGPHGGFGHGGGDPGIETGARYRADQDVAWVVLCNGEGTFDAAWALVRAAVDSLTE